MRLDNDSIRWYDSGGTQRGRMIPANTVFGQGMEMTGNIQITGGLFANGISATNPNGNTLNGGVYTNGFFELTKSGGGYIDVNTFYFVNANQNGFTFYGNNNFNFYRTNTTSGGAHAFYFASSLRAYIDTGGNFATTSDRRLKKDISDIDTRFVLNKIMRLKPKRFRMKQGDGSLNYGFIAQEVAEIDTERVIVPKTTSKNDYLSIRTTALVPLLVGAVQEQQKMIKDLEKAYVGAVQDLVARVEELEARLLENN
jgi:hypothetical protein